MTEYEQLMQSDNFCRDCCKKDCKDLSPDVIFCSEIELEAGL